MKIAVCDDDINELKRISFILDKYGKERNMNFIHKEFESSVELAESARNGGYDVYILDVIMPVLDGIALAREIRSFNRAADIIFLTSAPEFAVESYEVKAADYIIKPVREERLFSALNDIAEKTELEQGRFIVVKNGTEVKKIFLKNICFIEANERKIIYHMETGEKTECNGKFSDVCEIMQKNDEFILVHRSYLVNMNFISSIGLLQIDMQNGKTVPVAQRRVGDIKKRYLAFQMEEVL